MTNSNSFGATLQPEFKDLIGHLTPAKGGKEKGKYICPVCGDDNLSVCHDGKFKCFSNECDTKEIYIETLKLAGLYQEPRSENSFNSGTKRNNNRKHQSKKTHLELAKFESTDNIFTQSEMIPTPKFLKQQTSDSEVTRTTYWYSKTTGVYRYDFSEGKSISPFIEQQDGKIRYKKGNKVFLPYGLKQVDDYAEGKWILLVEGEKCVEQCKKLKLVAITFQGSDWTRERITINIAKLKQAKIAGILIFPDNDMAGHKKAVEFMKCAQFLGLPCKLIEFKKWFKRMNKGDDLVDVVGKYGAEATINMLDKALNKSNYYKLLIEAGKDDRLSPQKQASLHIQAIYGRSIEYNELTKTITRNRNPVVLDDLYRSLTIDHNISVVKEAAIDAFKHVASQHTYNPAKELIEHWAETVDPVDIERIPERYFGIKDDVLNSLFKKVLIAMMARLYNPGTKFDLVPILVGQQGCRKTTFWSTLGGDWHVISNLDFRSEVNILSLHQGLIVNLDEFDGVSGRKEVEFLKRFVTETHDNIRLNYENDTRSYPRQFIFVGSANNSQCLKDKTGNRRFVIYDIAVNKIDLERLRLEREGILTGAYLAYQRGESFMPTLEEEQANNELNENYQIHDPIEELVVNYLDSLEEATTREIIEHGLKMDYNSKDARSLTQKINAYAEKAGFKAVKTIKRDGKKVRGYRKMGS